MRTHPAGIVLLLTCAATAQAQRHRSEEAQLAEARSRFFSGAQLYQEGDYEAALAEFEESYRLAPAPVATFNVAQTLHVLRRYPEAVEAFRRYLQEAGSSVSGDRREQVERTIRELSRRIGRITLRVEPAEAEIRIDGRLVDPGVALSLGAGRRVLQVTAEGHVAVEDAIEVVGRRDQTIHVRLAPRESAATVRLTSDPPHARLRIDGIEVGAAPVERRIPHGGHVIEAEAPGREDYRASIELAPRQTLQLRVVLDEAREPRLYERWWFWTAASAVAITAVIAIVLLAQPPDPQPVPGNSFDGVIAVLRAP